MRSAQLVDALQGRCLLEDLAVEERLCLHRELRELGELMRGGETKDETKGEVDGDPDELSMVSKDGRTLV